MFHVKKGLKSVAAWMAVFSVVIVVAGCHGGSGSWGWKNSPIGDFEGQINIDPPPPPPPPPPRRLVFLVPRGPRWPLLLRHSPSRPHWAA
jgi:hypothetical protein